MNKRAAVAVLHCLVILLAATSSALGQASGGGLRETGITIKMESQPLGVVFRYLMRKYDIPIGFEESTLDINFPDYDFHANLPVRAKHTIKTRKGKINVAVPGAGRVFTALIHPITLDAKNESLAKVLDQIVWQMENYKWEINDGVVNIFPVKGRDERFEKLLGTKIQRFTMGKDDTVEDITRYITLLPEFIICLAENKLVFTYRGLAERLGFKVKIGRPLGVDMDFSNLTFRDLLNKITRIKRGGWALKWKQKTEKPGWEAIEFNI